MRGSPPVGPDPTFPVLGERDRYRFPDPGLPSDGIVGVGGNLSPGMLLSAYEQGIFPWFSLEDPVVWHSPDPRFVLFPEELHVSRSMEKVLRKGVFELFLDRDFGDVIRNCADVDRPGQDGTWITQDMIDAYTALHRLGWAHSCGAYSQGRLVGGCYGIRLGNAFFGESMFALEPNASKAAFLSLARLLFSDGVLFVDCQVPTEHLRSLGAREIPRSIFLGLLSDALASRNVERDATRDALTDKADRRGNWSTLFQL